MPNIIVIKEGYTTEEECCDWLITRATMWFPDETGSFLPWSSLTRFACPYLELSSVIFGVVQSQNLVWNFIDHRQNISMPYIDHSIHKVVYCSRPGQFCSRQLLEQVEVSHSVLVRGKQCIQMQTRRRGGAQLVNLCRYFPSIPWCTEKHIYYNLCRLTNHSSF